LRKIKNLAENSAYIGDLPAGCRYCGPGEKLVLLITGRCMCRCFYCPLSFKKRGYDVIYANELKVKSLDEIVEEGNNISAKGTGITGGDPMFKADLTIQAIELLKREFGTKHHIHLYTTGKFHIKYISKLAKADLDEIRFHPPMATWGKINEKLSDIIREALETDMLVGSEIPILPGYKKTIIKYAHLMDSLGVNFLNLNELEFSESNWEKLNARGYLQRDELANTVKGSEELAIEILNELSNDPELKLNIHYCSARFKDRQQLTNRIKRRAKNIKQPYHVVTDDGTFLIGIIEPEKVGHLGDLVDVQYMLHERFKVPQKLMHLDKKLCRLELATWVLDELRDEIDNEIKERCFIIEEYPTADRLEVERTPLDEFK
jgi:pyruvate formate-lyase activating enzyme-like uncharacterized protein